KSFFLAITRKEKAVPIVLMGHDGGGALSPDVQYNNKVCSAKWSKPFICCLRRTAPPTREAAGFRQPHCLSKKACHRKICTKSFRRPLQKTVGSKGENSRLFRGGRNSAISSRRDIQRACGAFDGGEPSPGPMRLYRTA